MGVLIRKMSGIVQNSFSEPKNKCSDPSNNNSPPTVEFCITLYPPCEEPMPKVLSPEENEVKKFMVSYVTTLFNSSTSLTLEQKSAFGKHVQTQIGQTWFARIVNVQRARWRCVSETTFYSLVQHFAIVLFECSDLDYFPPAKTLMNMCFTFYHEVQVPGCEPFREYLSTYLKNQPIWQNLRFWNAAFFEALQGVRIQQSELAGKDSAGERVETSFDEDCYLENITFGQLGTFICNMHAFGLDKSLCKDFLQKQYTIASLPANQEQMLEEHMNSLYGQTDPFVNSGGSAL